MGRGGPRLLVHHGPVDADAPRASLWTLGEDGRPTQVQVWWTSEYRGALFRLSDWVQLGTGGWLPRAQRGERRDLRWSAVQGGAALAEVAPGAPFALFETRPPAATDLTPRAADVETETYLRVLLRRVGYGQPQWVPAKRRGGAHVVHGHVRLDPRAVLGERRGLGADGPLRTESKLLAGTRAGDWDPRWPNGVIPYVVDAEHENHQDVRDGIAAINARTNLRLVPRTHEPIYVRFSKPTPDDGCSSSTIGRTRGVTVIKIPDGCTSEGTVMHEIFHAAGVEHEQKRPDRDLYVEVHEENVEPDELHNFQRLPDSDPHTPYDYESVMHYSASAFSENGKDTISVIGPGAERGASIGNRGGMSYYDILGINRMYPMGSAEIPLVPELVLFDERDFVDGDSGVIGVQASVDDLDLLPVPREGKDPSELHDDASSILVRSGEWTLCLKRKCTPGKRVRGRNNVAVSPTSGPHRDGRLANSSQFGGYLCDNCISAVRLDAPTPSGLVPGEYYSFQALRETGSYLMTGPNDFRGWLDPATTDAEKQRATFRAVPGLAGYGVSLQPAGYPDRFLCGGFWWAHQLTPAIVADDDDLAAFRRHCTYRVFRGLAGHGGDGDLLSFQYGHSPGESDGWSDTFAAPSQMPDQWAVREWAKPFRAWESAPTDLSWTDFTLRRTAPLWTQVPQPSDWTAPAHGRGVRWRPLLERTELPSLVDVDGGGQADLVVEYDAHGKRRWQVRRSLGTRFETPQHEAATDWVHAQPVAIADFGGDPAKDLLLLYEVDGATRLQVRHFDRDRGEFVLEGDDWLELPAADRWAVVGVAQIDGQAGADIVLRWERNPDFGWVSYLADPRGGFGREETVFESSRTNYFLHRRTRVAGVADIDGRAGAEVVMRVDTTKGARTWQAFAWTSGGGWQSTGEWARVASADARTAAIADLSGDGKADLLLERPAGPGKRRWQTWASDGARFVDGGAIAEVAPPRSGTRLVGLGDVNPGVQRGVDLVLQSPDGPDAMRYEAWSSTGVLQVPPAKTITASTSHHAIGVGDVDGDGAADLWLQLDDAAGRHWVVARSDGSGLGEAAILSGTSALDVRTLAKPLSRRLRNKPRGLCLDLPTGAANLELAACDGSADQGWLHDFDGDLRSAVTGFCVTHHWRGAGVGKPLRTAPCTTWFETAWHPVSTGDGWFQLQNRDRGTCLGFAPGTAASEGAKVAVATCVAGDPSQLWTWE